jgi:hypothetical protein
MLANAPAVDSLRVHVFVVRQYTLVASHFLEGLRSRPVDLPAYPVIFGVGVDPEFDRFVRGSRLGGCRGCHRF